MNNKEVKALRKNRSKCRIGLWCEMLVVCVFFLYSATDANSSTQKVLTAEQRQELKQQIKRFSSREPHVAYKTGFEIAKKFGRLAGPELIEATKDDDPQVRKNAVDTLAYIRYREAVPILTKLLKDKDKGVRVSTIMTITVIAEGKAIPVLKEMSLTEQNIEVLLFLGASLASLGDKDCVPVLLKVMNKDLAYGGYAAQVLRKVTGKDLGYLGKRETRKEARKKWNRWWEENEDTFELKEKSPFPNIPKISKEE